MHAVEITETGGPDVLRNVEKPTPSPGPSEVLISITSTSTAPKAQLSREAGAASGPVPPVDTAKVNASAHYPLKDAAQAHRDLEGRRTVGRTDALTVT